MADPTAIAQFNQIYNPAAQAAIRANFDLLKRKHSSALPKCEPGWASFSAPTDLPAPVQTKPALYNCSYSSSRMVRECYGFYQWENCPNILPIESLCGYEADCALSFYREENTQETITFGPNINLIGEIVEITGSYSYSWGVNVGRQGTMQVNIPATPCVEFMMRPIVLAYYQMFALAFGPNGPPWYLNSPKTSELGSVYYADFRSPFFAAAPHYVDWVQDQITNMPNGPTQDIYCYMNPPLYVRGGLLICSKPCCDDQGHQLPPRFSSARIVLPTSPADAAAQELGLQGTNSDGLRTAWHPAAPMRAGARLQDGASAPVRAKGLAAPILAAGLLRRPRMLYAAAGPEPAAPDQRADRSPVD